MPQWGLTTDLRKTEPWGIPEKWLQPGKVITDPIHGDIYLTRLEQAIVDSSIFQRLRRIRQLGTVHLVYPGATHTRFSHALGALRVVQDLLDIVLGQHDARRANPEGGQDSLELDLFDRWHDLYRDQSKADNPSVSAYDWRVAEVVVLARLGALLHDVCHVAYGHSIEDELGLLVPHDENPDRFRAFWRRLGDGEDSAERVEVRQILQHAELKDALRAVILDKEKGPSGADLDSPEKRLRAMDKYPFVADMVTNTICADLLDYLPRDHAYSGLPLSLGQRFMTQFYVVPDVSEGENHYPERMALRLVRRDGREREDVTTELLKHLRYRYELQERVIVHHAKLAADAMLGKALELWHDSLWIELAGAKGGAELARQLQADPRDHLALQGALVEDIGKTHAKSVDQAAKRKVESSLRDLGDDGLLEQLSGRIGESTRSASSSPLTEAVADLAGALLDRRLYKRAARALGPSPRRQIYQRFKKRDKRRELERSAAQYAGIPEDHVVIWLPNPKMRLKIAEVLVDYGNGILPFNEYSPLGQDIYDAHRRLWTVTVYVHPRVDDKQTAVVLARLAELMGLRWDQHEPPGAKRPTDWPQCLAAAQAIGDDALEAELQELLADAERRQLVQRAKDKPFSYLRGSMKRRWAALHPAGS